MADQYHSLTKTGVLLANFQAVRNVLLNTSSSFGVRLLEYNPTTQTIGVHLGGADLTAILAEYRNIATVQFGTTWTTDQPSTSGAKVQTGNDRRGS